MTAIRKTSGLMVAAAAAALFLSGAVTQTASADDAKVHCTGVNACKGQGSCKGASNACKGQNACKGLGFVEMGKDECTTKGGKVES